MKRVAIALAFVICTTQILAAERPRVAQPTRSTPRKQTSTHHPGDPGSAKSLARSVEILKKISTQQRFLEWTHKETQKAQASQKLAPPMKSDTLRQARLLGKRIPFLAAPAMSPYTRPGLAKTSAVSDLRINGRSSDTVVTGGKMNLTFSFTPGFISAVLRIYYDADHNGILSDSDPAVSSDILLLDGEADDLDPASGRDEVALDGILSAMIGTYILAVDDFQSVSTVSLVVQQKSAPSVVHISTVPRLPAMVAGVYGANPPVETIFTDSSGAVDVFVDRFATPTLNIGLGDYFGSAGSYLPQPNKDVILTADTTFVVFTFTPAPSIIRGLLTDDGGSPIRGALVYTAGRFRVQTRTDSLGAFRLGVDSMYWYVRADPPSSEYMTTTFGTPVFVVPHSVTDLRVALHKANSSISGSVKYSQTGVGGVPIVAGIDTLYTEVLTRADGQYTLPVWHPLSGPMVYTVDLQEQTYIYYDTTYGVQVPSGTTNLNFTLLKFNGGMQGRVTDARTGSPLAGVRINTSGSMSASRATDDSGRYYIPLRDGNSYFVSADARGYFNYSSQTPIIVAGSVVTRDISLSQCGIISGVVRNKSGHPIPYAYVTAHDSTYNHYGYASADLSGKYEIGNLSTGTYIVSATSSSYPLVYLTMYYPNVSNPLQAAPVSVTEGQETAGIDFVLPLSGSIAGKVTEEGGVPIPSTQITVYDTLFNARGSALTDSAGYYQTGGLPTGDYRVTVLAPFPYVSLWYDNALTFETASSVHVLQEETTSNINFILGKGAEISGFIRDGAGKALPYADAGVFDTLSAPYQGAFTNDSGWYHIVGIPPGVFKVNAVHGSAWRPQWYDHKQTFHSADTIHLHMEETRTGIDFNLRQWSGIEGSVVDSSSGIGLEGASIYLQDDGGGGTMPLSTDVNGSYSTPMYAGSKFSVMVVCEDTNHSSRSYYSSDGSPLIRKEAERVTITSDTTWRIIDFSIPADKKTSICRGSNLETVITNRGLLGSTGDTTRPSCRWPNAQGKNYLSESDFWFGYDFGSYLRQFGDFYGNARAGRWHAAMNFLESEADDHVQVQTAFYATDSLYSIGPNVVVRQVLSAWPNTDFLLSKQTIHYDGPPTPILPQLTGVHVGWFADFDVSPGGQSDLVGIDSVNSLVYAFSNDPGDSTYVGLCTLGKVKAQFRWWDSFGDTALQTESARYHLMAIEPGLTVPSMPRDYRVLASTELPPVNPGDSATIAVAYVAGKGRESVIAAAWAARIKYDELTNGMSANTPSASPQAFSLSQNYPNPFNPITTIKYTIAGNRDGRLGGGGEEARIRNTRIVVYDLLGREVAVLVDEVKAPGTYEVRFDARALASGVYFYRMQSGGFVQTRKLLLVR